MKQITRDTRSPKGFNEVWESWRYLFKGDLERIEHRTRLMKTEMKLEGVSNEYIADHLPLEFKRLIEQVSQEQEDVAQKGRKPA